MAEPHHLSALEQAAAMKRRELSPIELVEHYLARIERVGESVGAFVTVTTDRALAAAKRAEASLLEDANPPPLFGVPTAIKDLNLVAGVSTKFGSAVMNDFVSPIDDNVVTRLAAAGLVSLGKTNTPEFGLTCYTEPDVAPPARTPFDLYAICRRIERRRRRRGRRRPYPLGAGKRWGGINPDPGECLRSRRAQDVEGSGERWSGHGRCLWTRCDRADRSHGLRRRGVA